MTSVGPRLFINSFHVLVNYPFGRESSEKYSLPPFIDGSIRREPDLEHELRMRRGYTVCP
jgi:hypothetical protein